MTHFAACLKKWLFNKANTQTSKSLIYDITKVALAPLECARLQSLWHNICLSFYTQISFVSEQYWTRKWTRKCHPCKNHPGCCERPQTVGLQFISIQWAAATENVTCCHHTFKIWRSGPEFSETVDFVKGLGLKICSGYLLCMKAWLFKTEYHVRIITWVQMSLFYPFTHWPALRSVITNSCYAAMILNSKGDPKVS